MRRIKKTEPLCFDLQEACKGGEKAIFYKESTEKR